MQLKSSFRAIATALDEIPEAETTDFLARLVLILADELANAERFENAIQRAKTAIRTKEKPE